MAGGKVACELEMQVQMSPSPASLMTGPASRTTVAALQHGELAMCRSD
jgi:hypothetical protein